MRVFVIVLTIFFVIAFASMTVSGGYMIYKEVRPPVSSTDVKVKVSRDSLTVVLARATPGLIVFSFGAIGLILMVFRVPTKEMLGYRTEGGGTDGTGFMQQRKILSDKKTNIPLLVWWLLKSTERFERIEENRNKEISS